MLGLDVWASWGSEGLTVSSSALPGYFPASGKLPSAGLAVAHLVLNRMHVNSLPALKIIQTGKSHRPGEPGRHPLRLQACFPWPLLTLRS